MTTIIQDNFAVSKRTLGVLAASGLLLLTTGAAPAQTLDDTSLSAPARPGVFGTANSAAASADLNDDGEPSTAFEFTSPGRSINAAPGAAASGGSPVVNPAINTLADSTVHMAAGNAAVTLDAPRTSAALPTAAKAGVGAFLAGGLLALGIAAGRAMTQERARGRSMEA